MDAHVVRWKHLAIRLTIRAVEWIWEETYQAADDLWLRLLLVRRLELLPLAALAA